MGDFTVNNAQYVALAKSVLGDPQMSDRELGEHFQLAQQTIAAAKSGRMSDETALAIGELLVKHGAITHVGEVMLVAHAQRKSGRAKAALLDFAKKVLALALAAVAGWFPAAQDVRASTPDHSLARCLAERVGFALRRVLRAHCAALA